MATLLVIEDDLGVQAALEHSLTELGHEVRIAGTAITAVQMVTDRPVDLIMLDLGLPDLDGHTVLRMLRGITTVPIIISTARGAEESVVSALNAGADDYLVKPFSPKHLAARITAVLRRTDMTKTAGEEGATVFEVGELRVDTTQRTATLGTTKLPLSRKEFDLLAYLARRPNKVVTRRELINTVWDHRHGSTDDNTIDVHASWLRRKLGETAAAPRYLHTIRGVGFKLTAPDET
jgi:DNA-binding response OmpR family regulator